MAVHPQGLKKPSTAAELLSDLKKTVPESSVGLIDVIVIDVSAPIDKKAKGKSSKAKKTKP